MLLRYLNFTFIIITFICCMGCSNNGQTNILSDSEVRDIVYDVLVDMFNHENLAMDVEHHMGKWPDFYDLYSNGVIPNNYYSEKYWVDFGTYQVPTGQHGVDLFCYIFVLPKADTGEFYLATDYYDPNRLSRTENTPQIITIYECKTKDLVSIRHALLNGIDPSLTDYRRLGIFSNSGREGDTRLMWSK
jgi:hypothetical protein